MSTVVSIAPKGQEVVLKLLGPSLLSQCIRVCVRVCISVYVCMHVCVGD